MHGKKTIFTTIDGPPFIRVENYFGAYSDPVHGLVTDIQVNVYIGNTLLGLSIKIDEC